MQKKIHQRLKELKNELASGQEVLNEINFKQADTRNTLLRIQGAIQVLEELLEAQDQSITAENKENINS